MVNLPAYFDRIGYSGPTAPSAQTLRLLHRAHMLAVPFENLDIALGRKIECDAEAAVRKIVERKRGGFCYEMNGAFAALLRALGYRVTLLSARAAREGGGEGPEFDHLTLHVELEEPWLADVGFGDSFVEPLHLASGLEQVQGRRTFRLTEDPGAWRLEMREPGKPWKKQYSFTLQPRELKDFAGMCRYHQTSPESHFTQKRVCTRATTDGRVTLSEFRLIVTRDGQREETVVSSEAERAQALKEHFGVVL